MTKEQKEARDWHEFQDNAARSIVTVAKVVFFPLLLAWGLVHGLKAGIVATLEKTLEVMRAWE